MRCPSCNQEPDEVIESGPADHPRLAYYCQPCNRVWTAPDPLPLVDPGPTDEQRRRDLA